MAATFKALLGRLCMSVVLFSYFQNLSFRILRRKPFYYTLYLHFSLRLSHYCNLSLYHLSPFLLSYVAVSRSCRLSAFLPFTCTDKATVYFYWQIADEGQSFESTVKAMQSHARPRNRQFSKTSTGILTKLILKALYGDYFSREARRHF